MHGDDFKIHYLSRSQPLSLSPSSRSNLPPAKVGPLPSPIQAQSISVAIVHVPPLSSISHVLTLGSPVAHILTLPSSKLTPRSSVTVWQRIVAGWSPANLPIVIGHHASSLAGPPRALPKCLGPD